MGSLSNYAELKVLELVVGKTPWTTPVVYCALSTTDFTETGASGSEPTTPNNYIRQVTTGLWGTASAGQIQNSGAITFQQASGNWGTGATPIAYFALWDAATPGNGNCLAYGQLDASKSVASGDTVQFAASAITITAD